MNGKKLCPNKDNDLMVKLPSMIADMRLADGWSDDSMICPNPNLHRDRNYLELTYFSLSQTVLLLDYIIYRTENVH